MKRETFTDGRVVQTQEAMGTEMITKDGDGVETERRPLTSEELARFEAEGQPTPDEKLVAALEAATTITDLKAALIERYSD